MDADGPQHTKDDQVRQELGVGPQQRRQAGQDRRQAGADDEVFRGRFDDGDLSADCVRRL
jgi:hypothetical protein